MKIPIGEYIKIAVKNLKTRRTRSWLTVLGVVIGVFLVISLMSLSQGIKGAILSQLKAMGNDLIMVYPGDISNIMAMMSGDMKLSDDDLKTIEKISGVETVIPMIWKAETMKYEGKKKVVLVYGNSWKKALNVYKNDMGWTLSQGRWPIPGKREIIVGSLVPQEIFPNLRVGTEAVIKGKKFKIVGILNSLGSKEDDSMIGVDLKIFQSMTGERKGAKFAFVKVKKGFSADALAEKIKDSLNKNAKKRKGEDSTAFTVLTSERVANIVGNIMALIQAMIFGFASIAIVVGGIGIMNTMYTSVRERIREIGIMKAIGAKKGAITTIFLIESGFFGLIGGVGGVFLGVLFAKIIELYFQIHPLLYLKAAITPQLILFGLAFSFLVGCASGYLPARNAAKLNPVEALRYE
ncbi:MAG TPA: ABC transporter permease [Candidatus Parcubacteria bacterium]|nr:ABC transporter permease [Candidatus Parcubacteria bacterium]